VACLMRGGWMEVTMISRGLEISIAGGVAETEDGFSRTEGDDLYSVTAPAPMTSFN